MRRLSWELWRILGRVGWAGVAAIAAIAAVGVFHLLVLAGEPARIEAMREAIASQQARRHEQQGQPVELSVGEGLALRYQALPASTAVERTEVLARIQAAAAAEGLVLEQASYRLNLVSAEALDSLQIELPVKAGYGPLRRFIARVLHDTPALALEGLGISRASVADPGVEAQLRFTLYMRSPAGIAGPAEGLGDARQGLEGNR